MPSYRVLKTGFFNGKLYSPTGKRKTLTVQKAFKEIPSWLELQKPESKKEREKRLKEEKRLVEEIASNKEDVQEASFLGTGEGNDPAKPSSSVETI